MVDWKAGKAAGEGMGRGALLGSTRPAVLHATGYATRWPVNIILTLLLLSAALLDLLAGTGFQEPVTLVFVGDVMLGRDVAVALDSDWAAAFADLDGWLAGAELAFANLESPLTGAPFAGGRFDLRAPPAAVGALTAAGFDVVSLANNHALDGGTEGLAETVDTLARAGIVALPDSGDPVVFQFPGLQVALLAFLDTGETPDISQVTRAAAQADLVIVSMHWGLSTIR